MQDELYGMATTVARGLAKRWREDFQDVRQEILLACLQDGMDTSWVDDPDLPEDDWKEMVSQTKRWMRYAGERYCRTQKALREGYSTEDEAFYSLRRLEELLTWLLEVGIEAHPPVGRAESVSRPTGDPAEAGTHLASMLDVERALSRLEAMYRERLLVRFGPLANLSDDGIAALSQSEIRTLTRWHPEKLRMVLGSTGDQVRHRTNTALRALQRILGGESPWNRGPSPRKPLHTDTH